MPLEYSEVKHLNEPQVWMMTHQESQPAGKWLLPLTSEFPSIQHSQLIHMGSVTIHQHQCCDLLACTEVIGS